MTLERHKSKLIPDVDFNLEGRLFVTDTDGTFPLRGGAKTRDKLPGPDAFNRPSLAADDVQSYRSYDPKRDRDSKKRKYKPNQPSKFGQEVANLPNATWGSGASKSLQRRLRKKKKQREADYYNTRDLHGDRYGTYDGGRSAWSVPNKKKRKHGGTPEMGIGQPKTYRSLDLQAMRKYQKQKRKADRKASFQEIYGISNGKLPLMDGRMGPATEQRRTIHEERLPGILFIITGSMIFIIGIVKILICWWQQYFYPLWAGLLLLLLGILGAYHKGDYLTPCLNGCYIALGILSTAGTFMATWLSLHILIPTISQLSLDKTPSDIARDLNFTNWHESLAIEVSADVMVFLNMGFDIACLVLVLVSYFSLTSTMVCIGNHWDAVYRSTGECDYRGSPRFFNPLEQMSAAQATFLFGVITYELKLSDEAIFLSPLWVAPVIIFAGFFSFISLKRIDLSSMGMFSMFVEAVAIVACSVCTIMMILCIADESELAKTVKSINKDQWSLHIAAAVFDGIFIFFMLINVVYAVGIIFRHVRKLCCYECWNVGLKPQQTYA